MRALRCILSSLLSKNVIYYNSWLNRYVVDQAGSSVFEHMLNICIWHQRTLPALSRGQGLSVCNVGLSVLHKTIDVKTCFNVVFLFCQCFFF